MIAVGVSTVGTTDGSTFELSGENLALYSDLEGGISVLLMGISGDCEDGVRIIYSDLNTGGTTFTDDVECTLT
jgi:hypothetical protein